MLIHINSSNGVPIYEQIHRQVVFAVASGAVRPHERIPSVRELAQKLAINPNTVARAYRELQSAGVVELVRGEGLEVKEAAVRHCREERKRILRGQFATAVADARSSGLTDDDIRSLLEEALHSARRPKAAATDGS